MTREPDAADRRRVPVTSQTPAGHDGHDRLLVLRHAAGDPLDAAETQAVTALLAACPACAALPTETTAIARSVATLPVPPRPRDFRIAGTPAAAARRGRLARFLDGLPVLRMPVLQPVAGAALAIGLVVAGIGALPPGVLPNGGGDPAADAPKVVADASPAAFAASADVMSPAPVAVRMEASSPAPDGAETAARMAAPDAASPAADAAAADAAPAESAPEAGGTAPEAAPATLADPAADADTTDRLVLAGILLSLAGGGMLVLVRVARRTEDPLLR